MNGEDHIIIIPGLGNSVGNLIWATNNWRNRGVIPHVFDARWKIEESSLELKLNRAIKLVDDLHSQGKRISLLGNSAGSSFVINMFNTRPNKIHKVIINCGRVRSGDWPWFTFDQASASSPSFRESVILSESILSKMSDGDKKKIMTLRPLFDEIVPPSTLTIPGATNEVIPSIGHVLSITINVTLNSNKIISFLKEN